MSLSQVSCVQVLCAFDLKTMLMICVLIPGVCEHDPQTLFHAMLQESTAYSNHIHRTCVAARTGGQRRYASHEAIVSNGARPATRLS